MVKVNGRQRSHTVPNMAAADQFPHQSIARNTRAHKQNPFPSLVLRGTWARENNNPLKLARSTLLTVLNTRRREGTRVEG